MSNQQIFLTRDKDCIVENIHKFVEQNKGYARSKNGDASPLEKEHVIARFHEIANDILELDENEYPHFVFKNTLADASVAYWFCSYDEDDGYVEKSIMD